MKIVVIGGVAAGMSAASKVKRVLPGAEVVVFEKGHAVSYGACGLPYFVAGLNDDIGRLMIRTAREFEEKGIRMRTGCEVLGVDTASGTLRFRDEAGREATEHYDRLMVASGAAPVRPALPGIGLPGVYVLKTPDDGMALRHAVTGGRRVVVAGGGYIGVEVAESLQAAGCHVTLVEAAGQILAAFDPEIRDKLHTRMAEQGIDIRLNTPVRGIAEQAGRAAGVLTDTGTLPADVVVMALGVRPETGFLAGSSIALAPNGAVLVDRYQRTNIENIYSAGDCAMVYNRVERREVYQPLGTVANKCGRIAGENMAGGNTAFDGCLGSAAISVCGWEAARTGMGEATARELVGDVITTFVEANDRPPYYPGQTQLWIKLICDRTDGRILGGQAVGPKGAVLRVNALAAAITMGMTAGTLGMADFCYAPPFSEVWDALNIAGNTVKL